MFAGEKAKAFHVLQSLSFTASNLDGKMSLKIDSKENSLKTLADLFVACDNPSRSALCTEHPPLRNAPPLRLRSGALRF